MSRREFRWVRVRGRGRGEDGYRPAEVYIQEDGSRDIYLAGTDIRQDEALVQVLEPIKLPSEVEAGMTAAIAAHRARWSFYRIPDHARTTFRLRAVEARCGEPETVSAFAAIGVTDLMIPTVQMFDAVAAALAELPEDARRVAEADLFDQALSGGRA